MVVRRPAFGRHGNKVIAGLCSWEIIALVPGSPVPTISETVERHRWFGWLLLFLLGHHWYLEFHEAVIAVMEPTDSGVVFPTSP